MMTLRLSNNCVIIGTLELSAPLEEVRKKLKDICAEEQYPPVISSVSSPIPRIGWHLQRTTLDSGAVLEKLVHLAEVVGKLDTRGLVQLHNALSTDCRLSLDKVLQAAVHIRQSAPDNYEFIPDVKTDLALGKWLVENGRFEIADHLLPHLNYDSVGAEYRENHGGVFLTNGYAGIQTGALEQVNEERSVFQATLSANQNTFRLCFPVSEEQLEQVKERLGVDDFCRVDVLNIRAQDRMFPLMEMLPKGLVTLEELDALAECVQQMEREDGNILKYCSALEVENPATFSEAVTIAMDIDDYERVPEDMDEYGKQVLRRAGADDEVIDTIDGYMDFVQLGVDSMAEDGVRRTEFGLVRRISTPFPSEDMGQTMS